MIVALAIPPASHMVCSPYLPPELSSPFEHGHEEPRAGGAQRVAERDGATARVELVRIGVELGPPGQRHRGERLVDLDVFDVRQGRAGPA
jgi:hypothetical protein